MAFFQWEDKYSVNIKTIGPQHKKLFDMINDLHDAMSIGKSKEVLEKIIKGLVDYTVTHFSTEEQLFNKYAYPETTKHKGEYDAFIKKVLDFQTQFKDGGMALSIQIMTFLSDWLRKHILGTDKKYTPFLNSKGIL